MSSNLFYSGYADFLKKKGTGILATSMRTFIKKDEREAFEILMDSYINPVLNKKISVNDISLILASNNIEHNFSYKDFPVSKEMLKPHKIINPFNNEQEITNYINDISCTPHCEDKLLNLVKFIPLTKSQINLIFRLNPKFEDVTIKNYFMKELYDFNEFKETMNNPDLISPHFVMCQENLRILKNDFCEHLNYTPLLFCDEITMDDINSAIGNNRKMRLIYSNNLAKELLKNNPSAKEYFLETQEDLGFQLYPDITNSLINSIFEQMRISTDTNENDLERLTEIIQYGNLNEKTLNNIVTTLIKEFPNRDNLFGVLGMLINQINSNKQNDLALTMICEQLIKNPPHTEDAEILFKAFKKIVTPSYTSRVMSVFHDEFIKYMNHPVKKQIFSFYSDFYLKTAILKIPITEETVIDLCKFRNPALTLPLMCRTDISNKIFINNKPYGIKINDYEEILKIRSNMQTTLKGFVKEMDIRNPNKIYDEVAFPSVMEYYIRNIFVKNEIKGLKCAPSLSGIFSDAVKEFNGTSYIGLSFYDFYAPYISSANLKDTIKFIKAFSYDFPEYNQTNKMLEKNIVARTKLEDSLRNCPLFKVIDNPSYYPFKNVMSIYQFLSPDETVSPDDLLMPYEINDVELYLNFPMHRLTDEENLKIRNEFNDIMSSLSEASLDMLKYHLFKTHFEEIASSIIKFKSEPDKNSDLLPLYSHLSIKEIITAVLEAIKEVKKEKNIFHNISKKGGDNINFEI